MNDYNIQENSRPNKVQLMAIPQRPSQVYDCINNVNKLIQPPPIELESHSTYRDNYYNTIRGKPKAFNKNMGYFSYFNEKTRREREMNHLYSRKNLSKFTDKIRGNSHSDQKEMCPKLSNTFKRRVEPNTRYNDSQKWNSKDNNNSLRLSMERTNNNFNIMQNRRASNQVAGSMGNLKI